MNATGLNTVAFALVTALLAACVGAPPPAALAPAQGSTLVACEALSASFTFARTKVTAATAVPVGEVSAAGMAIGPHCRVVGAMNDRVSPVVSMAFIVSSTSCSGPHGYCD